MAEAIVLAARWRASVAEMRNRRGIPHAHGPYAQKRAGTGTQFWQYRPLVSGESIQRIDWRQYAKTDRYFVRDSEAQHPQNTLILCEANPSMTIPPEKAHTAHVIALAAMLFFQEEQTKVTLLFGTHKATTPEHAAHILEHSCGESPTLPNLTDMRIVYISDFLSSHMLEAVAGYPCAVAVVQVLTRQEQTFPFTGHVQLEDAAHAPFKSQSIETARDTYLQALAQVQDNLTRLCQRSGWLHVLHTVDNPLTQNADLAKAVCSA